MEVPQKSDEDRSIAEDEGRRRIPRGQAATAPAQGVLTTQQLPVVELKIDADDLTDTTSPSRQRLLDKVEEARKNPARR